MPFVRHSHPLSSVPMGLPRHLIVQQLSALLVLILVTSVIAQNDVNTDRTGSISDSALDQNVSAVSTSSSSTKLTPRATTTTTATTTRTTTPKFRPMGGKKCQLEATNQFREKLQRFLEDGAKLVVVSIFLRDHPPDMLIHALPHVHQPYHWVRSTSRQGRSLLMLEENYSYMSMSTLSIGVEEIKTNLTDHPRLCLRGLSPNDTLRVIRDSFLNDFKVTASGQGGSLSDDEHICNMHIIPDDGYAKFKYRCCRRNSDGNIDCLDMERDHWVQVLLTLIVFIKVLVVLYSPMFIPESVYRLKYVAAQYIHHTFGAPISVKVVVTQDPAQFGDENKHKVLRLSQIKNMEYFKTMVSASRWIPEKIYEVQMKDIKLSVKARRLLDHATVPVTMIKLLYNNLMRCRIRKFEALRPCCDANILGRFNPGIDIMPWSRLMKLFAGVCFMVILFIPWIIRVAAYFDRDQHIMNERRDAANRAGLKLGFSGSFVMTLTPLHGLFIIIYLIFIVDSMVYGVISSSMKEKFKFVLRQCLRDMRERSRIAVLTWMTRLILLPFKVFGVVGLLLFIPYLVILLIITIPVMAFYILPTLNLTIRLIIHIFIFMCPDSVMAKFKEWNSNMASVKERLKIHEVTANENFVKKSQYTTKGVILQLVVVTMCLISFWSLTLLLMEIFSFFVEVFVYTFMGIIVNAGVTMQYVTVLALLFLYSKNTFSRVHRVYLAYHKIIHKELIGMKREEINEVAKQEALDQENTAFTVVGEMAANKPSSMTPVLKVKDHQPVWMTSGMLIFLDKHDTPMTPEKFFYETIDLNYFACPGPIYRIVGAAVWEFSRIVMFLLFVFVVVMAFGDAYHVSTTNQLLATVVGGFVPFLFRYIFKSSSGVEDLDTTSIQFKTEFHKAINDFRQSWSVFDITPIAVHEWTGITTPEDVTTAVDGNGSQPANIGDTSTEIDPNSSIAPLLDRSTESGAVDSRLLERPTSYISMTEDTADIDIIIDVSTTKTRYVNSLLTKGFERGSVSMLDSSYNKGTSARIYNPTNERAIDV